jgi:hypothetical protein
MSESSVEVESSGNPDGYLSLLMRVWIEDDWRVVRGFIEEVHTGRRLPLDLSALASFLRDSAAGAIPSRVEEAPGSATGVNPSAEP